MTIPFNKAFLTGNEFNYISQAKTLAGDGEFTRKCNSWLEKNTGCLKALLTHSCTAALEMSALLLDIQPGDEIIMPSYTFVSTANAFVLRGGVPVFVDIRRDTLNIDETLIEAAISPRTKAIVPVHYAGVACEMDSIMSLADKYNLHVVEDAAQGVLAYYKHRPLGTIGHLGAYSFHETKNIISGEGGALLINKDSFCALAEIIREKGTDRSRFFRGQVDKYTWQHVGSSFLPSELIAAFLFAQLEESSSITERRLSIWNLYHQGLADLEQCGLLKRPTIPLECQHNAHMYYVILPDDDSRSKLIDFLKQKNISALFHYTPLHSSAAGKKYGRSQNELIITETTANRLLRLPLYAGMSKEEVEKVISGVHDYFAKLQKVNAKEKMLTL